MKIQSKIILSDRSNMRAVEAETQYEFTQYVLSSIGLPEEVLDLLPPWELFTVEYKIKLRDALKKFSVTIIDDRDGGIVYYVGDEKVAEWFKPDFKIKMNPKALAHSDRHYIEIHAKFWLLSEDV